MKTARQLLRVFGVFCSVLLSFSIADCARAQQGAVPVAIIDPSFWVDGIAVLNGLDGPVRTVIRSEVEWKRFWLAQQLPSYAQTPTGLDFNRHMLLIVGPDVSNVMEARIEHVSRVRDTVVAYVDLETGERASGAAPCAIFPVKAVVIQRVDLPVRFVERTVPRGC
jgi:hypothetical protein